MRRLVILVAALLLLQSPALALAGNAAPNDRAAASRGKPSPSKGFTDWQPERRSYFFSSEKYSDKIKRCITVDISGDWSFQWMPALDPNSPPRGYRNLKVSNAKMEVYTRNTCSRASGTWKNVNSVDMWQRWTPEWLNAKDCDLNPSISVGFPGGASLAITPECSDPKLKTGYYKTTETGAPKAHYFYQYNDGSSISINRETSQHARFCYNLVADVTVHNAGEGGSTGSDSVPAITKQLCTWRDHSKCPGDPTCQSSPRLALPADRLRRP